MIDVNKLLQLDYLKKFNSELDILIKQEENKKIGEFELDVLLSMDRDKIVSIFNEYGIKCENILEKLDSLFLDEKWEFFDLFEDDLEYSMNQRQLLDEKVKIEVLELNKKVEANNERINIAISKLKEKKQLIGLIINFIETISLIKGEDINELKRILEKLVRKICVYEKDCKSITINLACKYLGNEVINYLPKVRDYGISNVLAYTMMGGQITHVEVAKYKGSGKLTITGNSGDILKESARVVLTYLTSEYEIESQNFDVHVHFINAAQKKDGPSAGVSIAVAMLSLFQKRVIDGDIAFTGEITLKGDIMPIGGLKDKLIAAAAVGIKSVFIPKANELDLADVPVTIFDQMAVNLVSNFSEIYDVLFR